jgi:hypothetical protein
MRFLMYTIGDDSTPIPPPSPEMMAEMGKFMNEITKAACLSQPVRWRQAHRVQRFCSLMASSR